MEAKGVEGASRSLRVRRAITRRQWTVGLTARQDAEKELALAEAKLPASVLFRVPRTSRASVAIVVATRCLGIRWRTRQVVFYNSSRQQKVKRSPRSLPSFVAPVPSVVLF